MDDKLNPTAVGAFVLLLGALLVAGVLWLATDVGRQRNEDPYQAFIRESVAGLNVDAPVKYLGVDVGKVSRIDLDPRDSRQVRLLFLIQRGTPIKRDSFAVLKTQGLTGIAYIEISGGSEGAAPLPADADGPPPTIPFKPSLSARLENVLTNVLGNVDRVSNNLNAVFDADNRLALKTLLADTAALAKSLAAQRELMARGIADIARTARGSALAVEQLRPELARTLAGIERSAEALARMAADTSAASGRVGSAADAAASGLQQLGNESLPELARLAAELQQLAASVRRLSDQTAASPSSLLQGRPQPAPGPGEGAPR
jgi:phospholipid/cholesterol/gamma-HCH transport system substrate-binding protein